MKGNRDRALDHGARKCFSALIITSDETAKRKRIKTVIRFMFSPRDPIKANDRYWVSDPRFSTLIP